MIRSVSAIVIALFGLASAANAAPFFVIAPNGQAAVDGNSSNNIVDETPQSFRLQFLFGSGHFVSIGEPILINQMAFRAEPGTGVLDGSGPNIDIYFSTSPRYPNLTGGAALLMSTTFDDNVGPDNMLVYSGPLVFASPGCPIVGTTPCAWDLVIDLDTPFFYDLAAGRLLVDMWFTEFTGKSGEIDGHEFAPYGGISSLFGSLPPAEEGEGVYGGGFVTRFAYTSPIPEPSSWSLLFLGSVGFGFLLRRKRERRRVADVEK